ARLEHGDDERRSGDVGQSGLEPVGADCSHGDAELVSTRGPRLCGADLPALWGCGATGEGPQGHGESRSCRPPREEVVACRPRILEDLEVVHGASSAPGCGCDG